MMHLQYKTELRPVLWLLLVLSAILLASWQSPPIAAVKGIAGYVPLHTLLETIAIVIATLVFGVCWAAYSKERPANLVLLACVFLAVALLDFLHTVSVKGMPDFVTPGDPEKAINFWLAARYVSALGLLLVALRPWTPLRHRHERWWYLWAALLLVALAAWVGLFHPDWLPRTFIPGEGLTTFKLVSEYILIAIFTLTSLLFLRQMRTPQPFDITGLFTATSIMAISELFFTLYSDTSDLFLVMGHVYKVIAYAFVYKSIFLDNVKKPYQQLTVANRQLEGEIEDRLRMEEKQQQTDAALRTSEERWKYALEGAGDGVWDWQIQTGDVVLSRRWKEMLGYAEHEIGTTLEDWSKRIHPDDMLQVMTVLQDHIDGKGPYATELRLRCKDGSWKWVLDRGKVVSHDDRGRPQRMIGTITDISERKRMEEELRHTNETLESRVLQRTRELDVALNQAEAASTAKSQFLANMSHDIRTPMNSIIGMATLALRTGLDNRQRDYVSKIHQSAQQLLAIINDILDISKIEAGKLKLEEIDFSLESMCDNLSSQLNVSVVRKGLQLNFDIDPQLLRPWRGDPLRLHQVLTNYAGNAIKFTARGAVTVRVRCLEEAAESCLMRFEVQDSGIGIDAAVLPTLFEPFRQGDASTTRKYGGTGLGLAISKQLVELMGGEVGAESQPGSGSCFWFSVRLRKGEGRIMVDRAAEEVSAGLLRGATLLLVEDNPVNQQVGQELLEQAGATVLVAGNGVEAVAMLRNLQFDCVLMDVQMPEMDGLEATRRIRDNPALRSLPVIAMTANARSEDQATCRAAGMDDFIAKPIDPEQLYNTVAHWLHERPVPVPTPVPEQNSATAATAASNGIDLAVIGRMWSNNPQKIRQYAMLFMQALQRDMNDIDAALASADLEQLRLLGHRAKSSAATLGAQDFVALCLALERMGADDAVPRARDIVNNMQKLLTNIVRQIELALP